MNVQDNPNAWAVEKFAIGQPVPRTEDPKLVQGQGRYTDDVSLPNQAYAVILRSRHAHGVIRKIDTSAAKTMPGVLAVYTGADLDAVGYGPLKTVMPLKGRDGNLDEGADALRARNRQGALRRRSDRLRGGGDRASGQGRGRSDRCRHRSPARRHHPARSREGRRAATL